MAISGGVLLLVALAETLTTLVNPLVGLIAQALLLIGLLLRGTAGRPGPQRNLMLALALAPLIRLLSLSLPLAGLPALARYPAVGIPLLIALWLLTRVLGLSPADLGLSRFATPLLPIIVCAGPGIGVLEYHVLSSQPLVTGPSWSGDLVAALILVLFTGFVEELIFRGICLRAAWPVMGHWSIVFVSLLFAALHIGYGSTREVLLAFGVGALFCYFVVWTRSLLSVVLAHGLANITLYLVMPFLASTGAGATVGRVLLVGAALAIVGVAVAVFPLELRSEPGYQDEAGESSSA